VISGGITEPIDARKISQYSYQMDQSKIDGYKTKLERQRTELMKEFEKDEKPDDFGSDVDSLEEEASESEAMDNKMAAGAGLKERINEIDMALNKIRMGKFGLCEKCGKEIGADVLAVSPESRLCKQCKQSLAKNK
jgi:DnaK suppressor protein